MTRLMSKEDSALFNAAKNRLAEAHVEAQRPNLDMLALRMALSRLRQAANALSDLSLDIEDRTRAEALKKLEHAR